MFGQCFFVRILKGLMHPGLYTGLADSSKRSRSEESPVLSAASPHSVDGAARRMSRALNVELSGCMNRGTLGLSRLTNPTERLEGFARRLQWITTVKLLLSHKVSGKKGLLKVKWGFGLGAVARFEGIAALWGLMLLSNNTKRARIRGIHGEWALTQFPVRMFLSGAILKDFF